MRARGRAPHPPTTPAKAGAQLGNVANEARSLVTTTFPIGPRPSPGWSVALGGTVGIRVARGIAGLRPSLFSREGGSPVWIPAFAGKQSSFFDARLTPNQ